METRIEIIVNGMKEKFKTGTTVADVILHVGENDKGLIVERNNRFVHPHAYASTTLYDGDRIELINPDFGG